MPSVSRAAPVSDPLPYRVRRSPIHGTGVFARRDLRKGERIMEYVGERISHAEADRRYEHKAPDDNHTFLFTVDSRTVIDAGVDGNEARWVNHCCDPNCETVIENKRVFVETVRAIPAGQELTYDYMIGREAGDPPNIDEIFACRCGSPKCRGTMLLPPEKKRKRSPARANARRKAHAETASGANSRRGTSSRGKSQGASRSKSKSKPGRASGAGRRSSR
ncbi:MAG: SET domain-containing protein-lysine N-methyltransferase [Steroidobacteraceae bacterium]|jgi:SET domain-containing protein|nr:SET domain-containing protein-lysine N-methyltransferase [Steroidobacteraceae bacterium]